MSINTDLLIEKQLNPFKFLNAFTSDEGKIFYGRDNEIELLYDLVRRRNITLVFGETGVGKTSLVQCGLSKRFQSADWYDVIILRNENINDSLRDTLNKNVGNSKINKGNLSIPQLIDALYIDNFKPIYLIFDQLEELYVNDDKGEINDFYNTISEILETKTNCCKIIFIIREDFHAKLNDFEIKVAPLFASGFRVNRLNAVEAEKVVFDTLNENIAFLEVKPSITEISKLIVHACANNGMVHLLNLQILLYLLYDASPLNAETSKRLFTRTFIKIPTNVDELLKEYVRNTVRTIENKNEILVWDFLHDFVSDQNTKQIYKFSTPYKYESSGLDIYSCLKYLTEKQILRQLDENHFELVHDCLVPIIQFFQPKIKKRLDKAVIDGNPYKGLLSYDESDSNIFYGRKEVIDQLYGEIIKRQIIPVVGASGSGKSSLIKAGILPKLRENGFFVLPTIKPGKFPEENIRLITNSIEQGTSCAKFVLYIDQYEELVSQCEDQAKRIQFINFIKTLVDQPKKYFRNEAELKILLSVRSDFEPQLQNLILEKYWAESRFLVPPFSKDQLKEIVEEPAYLARLEFKPLSLIEIIAGEAYGSNNLLPLLSYTLSELYVLYKKSGRTDGFLTTDDYKMLGGVIGGLSMRANTIYDNLTDSEQESMRHVFIRMLSLSTGELAGRRASEFEFAYLDETETKKVNSILFALIENRLIVSSKDSEGNIFYEPAHDSLVRSWGKLWSWINEENGKEILSLQSQLRGALLSFKAGALWDTNNRLPLLEAIVYSKDNWLNKIETDFVNASIKKRNEIANIKLKNERDKEILNQRLLEEQSKAFKLLQEKLSEEQKSAELLKEKFEEQEQANARYQNIYKQNLDEQQKRTDLLKKSKTGLIIGICLLALIAAFGINYYSIKEGHEQGLNSSLIAEKSSAENARDSAENAKDSAEKLLTKFDSLHIEDKIYAKRIKTLAYEYKYQLDSNVRLLSFKNSTLKFYQTYQDQLKKQNNYKDSLLYENEKFKARIDLQKEPFYSYYFIDSAYKEHYIDSLIAFRFDQKSLTKYLNFKNALNKATDALDKLAQNPNKALVLAKQAHDISDNQIIDSIGLVIANNNLFYSYKIEVPNKIGATRLSGLSRILLSAISADKFYYAFASSDGIRTGHFMADSLTLDREVLSDYLGTAKNDLSPNNYNPEVRILSLSFNNDNELVAVTNDNKIYRWDFRTKIAKIKSITKSFAVTDKYYVATILSDGTKVIRDFNEIYIKIIDLQNGGIKILKNAFVSDGGYIKKLICAPNGKKVIVSNSISKCWLLDVETGISKQIGDSLTYNANFTSDGKNIIYESKDSIFLNDIEGNKIGRGTYNGFGYNSKYMSENILISTDWRNLFIQNSLNGISSLYRSRLIQNLNNKAQKDSLFYFTDRKNSGFTKIRFTTSNAIDYLDNNSILCYNYSKPTYTESPINLLLLKVQGEYDNFTKAYNSINPYLTNKDKEDLGLIKLGENEMYDNALNYYDQSQDNSLSPLSKKFYLFKAKSLLDQSIAINKENENYIYYLKLVDRGIFFIDSNFTDYANAIKKHIEIDQFLLTKFDDTSGYKYKYYKHNLSRDYGNLAYYMLFFGDTGFAQSIEYSKKGLELDPTNDFIYTNLALGYLFNQDSINAKRIYKLFKEKYSNILEKSFKKAFLEDLSELERKGVISAKKEEIYKLVHQIKCYLRDEGCSW